MEGARPMRRPEPFADLCTHLQRSRRAHPPALPQLVSQGELASALVDEEERLHQVDAGPERPRDVRMVQLRDRGESLRLGDEPLDGLGIGRVAAQQLHHHRVAAGVLCQPGMREPSGAQLVQQPETGDLRLLQGGARLRMREPLAPIAEGLARDRGSERSAAVQARAHRAETVRLLLHASDSTSRVRAAQRRGGLDERAIPAYERCSILLHLHTGTVAACDMWARVADPPELPEQFAPTGPKQSPFRVVPSPPLRPTLFPDEARFALRLSVLSGCAEFAAWAWFAHAGEKGAVLGWAALRLLKPVWAWTGTRFPRSVVAFSLLLLALFGVAASLLTVGQLFTAALLAVALPAFGDLCAGCAADGISVGRRSAAFAWLDMAQGRGGATGVAVGASFPRVAAIVSVAALLAASIGVPDLQDRGTPRTTWTLAAHEHALHSRFGAHLVALAFFGGFFAMQQPSRPHSTWMALLFPLAGMAIAARADPYMPNAVFLPRAAVLVAVAGLFLPPLRLLALGGLFAALPASVARGAGEMERPVASSLVWSALGLGAAVGAVLLMSAHSAAQLEGRSIGGAHVLDGSALHAGAPAVPQDSARLRRARARPARSGVGRGGDLPARDLSRHGGDRGARPQLPRERRRRRGRLLVRGGPGRGADPLPGLPRPHGAAGAVADRHADHRPDRHGRAEEGVPRPRARRGEDRRARHLGAGRGKRRREPAHHGSPQRRRVRDQRREDVDHERDACRLHHARRAHRRPWARRHLAGDLPDRREGIQRLQEAGEGGKSLLRYRASLLRGLPDPGPLPARRGERRLLPRDDQLPGRAAGRGHRRGRRHAAAGGRRAPLRKRAHRLRQAAGQVPGLAPSPGRTPHGHRGGALAHLPRLRSLQPQGAGGEGDQHGQAPRRRSDAEGRLRLPAAPRRDGIRRGDAGRSRLSRRAAAHHRRRHERDH